jgi:hypothetical protein
MDRIQNYFYCIAKGFSLDAERAGISSTHKPDIGTNRERVVEIFLRKHLPKRLTPTIGGQIIGYKKEVESNQIDIIVSSDISIRFEEDEKAFVTAESVAAAITVKSYLDKSALEDCLLNIASIPQYDGSILSFKMLKAGALDEFVENHPSLYVFAYTGIQAQTCFAYLKEFYEKHPEIPKNRYPKGIIVNQKFMITYHRSETRTNNGDFIEAGTFHLVELQETMWGYPFIYILNNISTYIDWLPFMSINIHGYFNHSFGLQN